MSEVTKIWFLRLVETRVPSQIVNKLFSERGRKLINSGGIVITNSRTGVGAVLPPETPLIGTLKAMEQYAIHS